MTPTWHTGHKAASTPFLATQPITPRRLRALLVTRARRGAPRACPLLSSLPRTRRFAPTSPRVRAHCPSLPRGRRPAPTGARTPVPPFVGARTPVPPPPATARPSRLASHRRARSVLTSARRFWLKMSIYGNPHPHRENVAASLAPFVGPEARILPVSRPIVTRMARESLPSRPSSHLPSPEIDIFSQNRAPQDTNRCSSVQTGAGSTQMEPRAQRTGIPARHTGGKPIPARNPLSSASCRARYPAA